MNEELKKIFGEKINIDDEDIPVAHLKYKGKSKKYITWSLMPETPIFASDDEIRYSLVTVDIDIFSESNYLNIMSSIKKIMKENEWTWEEDSEEMYEGDTALYHRTSTFRKERKV